MKKINIAKEQLRYASVLKIVGSSGLIILIIGFIIYSTGILPTIMPISKTTLYWGLKASEFVENTNMPVGLKVITLFGYGDMFGFLGIIILAATSLICFIIILPTFIHKKDIAFVIIITIQILVLLIVISGIIGGE